MACVWPIVIDRVAVAVTAQAEKLTGKYAGSSIEENETLIKLS